MSLEVAQSILRQGVLGTATKPPEVSHETTPTKTTSSIKVGSVPVVNHSTSYSPLMTPMPSSVVHENGFDIITLPDGTEFQMDSRGNAVPITRSLTSSQKNAKRGGTFQDTKEEVDHIIPVALGGTDSPGNLRAAKSKKTISQTVFDFVTGKRRLPGEYKPENRQEGKMIVEWRAIEKYQKGEISLFEAMAAVRNYDNKELVNDFLKEDFYGLEKKAKKKAITQKAGQALATGAGLLTQGIAGLLNTPAGDKAAKYVGKKLKESRRKGIINDMVGFIGGKRYVDLEDGKSMILQVGEGLDAHQAVVAQDVIEKNIESERNAPVTPFIYDTPRRQILSTVTAPIRWTAGSLAKFLVNTGLELTGTDAHFTPETELQEFVMGKDDFVRIAKSDDIYGTTERFIEQKLESAGVAHDKAHTNALTASILLGGVLENPFFSFEDKAIKEGLEQVAKKALERELGGELSDLGLERIAKETSRITTIQDPIRKQQVFKEFVETAKSQPDLYRRDLSQELSGQVLNTTPKVGNQVSESELSQQAIQNLTRETELSNIPPIKNPPTSANNFSYEETLTRPPVDSQEARGASIKFEAESASGSTIKELPIKVDELKDISGFTGQTRDIYRNFKAVFGEQFDKMKQLYLDPFDNAKGKFIDDQKTILKELDQKIIKNFGIKKGSNESAAIMDFGEGVVTHNDLIKTFGGEKTAKIVEADKWFRKKYDEFLDQVNFVRKEIYPNNPDKIIPKRKDYYRHYSELANGLVGLKNIFETPAGISSSLSGISEFTIPKSKWLSFAQKRLGITSERDAVGGFLNYLPSYAYVKNIDPFIGRFRDLAKKLAEETENSRNVNNFIEFLQDFSNDLAGKTNPADRFIQKVIPGGRKAFRVLDWLNNRVKANTILGNASSSISQLFNIPQGIASSKFYSINGAARSLAGIFADETETAIGKSNFIKERYFSSAYSAFDKSILANTKKMAAWITGVFDEVGTKFIWNSHYEKAIAQGIENPIKYADDITRSLVAGRGVGEVPLLQKSKLFQIVAPFQLEVGNLWWVMKDMVSERQFGSLATLFVASYLMNRVAEKVKGSDVIFDPINAIVEGFQSFTAEDNKTKGATKFAGRFAGEILGNVPFGQTVAGALPETFKVPGGAQITREELFGRGDPTRYGGGLLIVKGLTDPLFKVLPPFGGVQVKKTIGGVEALKEGSVYSKSGKTKFFDVKTTIGNVIRGFLFGKYATQEGQNYSQGKENDVIIETAKHLVSLPNNQAAQEFDHFVEENPELKTKLTQEIRDLQSGITDKEKEVRSLGVADGTRAQAVFKELSKLKTQAEKAALWDDYVAKKILTKDVQAQVLELLKYQ